MILGVDCSHWDWTNEDDGYSPIDYPNSEAVFTILKSCDGPNDTPYYEQEAAEAKAAGKYQAAYVWCHGRNWYDPRAQGEHWYNKHKNDPLLFVDFESHRTSIPNYDDLYNAVYRMRELGYKGKLVLYTNWGYWLSYGSKADVWLTLFDGGLWLSDPDDDPPNPPQFEPDKTRKAPAPFDNYIIHQFSFSGDPSRYGITNGKKVVDENRFEGTMEELAALFGQVVTPPPQEETMNKVTVLASALNVRPAPNSSNTPLRQLKQGSIVYTPYDVEVKAGGNVWIRISEFPVEYVAVSNPTPLSKVEAVPGGGEIKPVIHLTAEGYPENTWTPL